MQAAEQLSSTSGTVSACRALGVVRSTLYRHRGRLRHPAIPARAARNHPRALDIEEQQAVLAELRTREVHAVLVEGGAEVHGAFLDAGLVDRVALFVAPLLLGGRAAPGVAGGAGRELKHAVRLERVEVARLGEDLLLEADVAREARA